MPRVVPGSLLRVLPRALALALAALVAIVAAACDPFGPGPTSRLPSAQYQCNRFPFDPATVDRPGVAERANDDRAKALVAFLQVEDVESAALPDVGWHLVGSDATSSEFVVHSTQGYSSIQMSSEGGGWAVAGYGACTPELVMAEGARAAMWQLPVDAALPTVDATSFDVLVFERQCASGQPADGRVRTPEIAYEADRLLIAFGVTPPDGGGDCQAAPPTRVTVQLKEPLGARSLFDVSVWPPIQQGAVPA